MVSSGQLHFFAMQIVLVAREYDIPSLANGQTYRNLIGYKSNMWLDFYSSNCQDASRQFWDLLGGKDGGLRTCQKAILE